MHIMFWWWWCLMINLKGFPHLSWTWIFLCNLVFFPFNIAFGICLMHGKIYFLPTHGFLYALMIEKFIGADTIAFLIFTTSNYQVKISNNKFVTVYSDSHIIIIILLEINVVSWNSSASKHMLSMRWSYFTRVSANIHMLSMHWSYFTRVSADIFIFTLFKQFIFESAAANCFNMAVHRHGCCVLQRCISNARGVYQANLIVEICARGFELAQDPFG